MEKPKMSTEEPKKRRPSYRLWECKDSAINHLKDPDKFPSMPELLAPENRSSSAEWYETHSTCRVTVSSLKRHSSDLQTSLAMLEDVDEVQSITGDFPPRVSRTSSVGGERPESLPPSFSSTNNKKKEDIIETKPEPLPSTFFGKAKPIPNKRKVFRSRMTMQISATTGEVLAPDAPPSPLRKAIQKNSTKTLPRKKSAPPPVNMAKLKAAKAKALEKRKTIEAMNRKKSFDAINPLKTSDIQNRTTKGSGTIGEFNFAWQSQRGYYPNDPRKENQDACLVLSHEDTNGKAGYYGVYDGHGKYGDKCSKYVSDNIPKLIKRNIGSLSAKSGSRFDKEYSNMYIDINNNLHRTRKIDDSVSGTTAASAWVEGDIVKVANIGDSRVIVGRRIDSEGETKDGERAKYKAIALSNDQTPYRKDERDRIKKTGARVLTYDMLEGNTPIHENWDIELGVGLDEGGDPPRVWSPTGKYPGNAFTRSIGDKLSESLGVYAEPELTTHQMVKEDEYIVVASDGIWEFMTNQQCLDLITSSPTLEMACSKIVAEAYMLWITNETRTDDITAIICQKIKV